MRKSLMLTTAVAALFATVASTAAAEAGTWVPANVPLQGSNFTVFDINDDSVVTGSFTNSSGIEQGAVGPFDGSNYTSFDDGGGSTQPRGLNDKGWITGFDTATLQQWERSPSGTLKDITWHGNPVDVALVMGINKSGVFVGDYLDTSGVEGVAIGRRYKYTGVVKIKSCDFGCAGRAIDDAKDVGGWYYDSSGIQHGFLKIGKKTTDIDYPGAFYTVVEGMNNKGTVSGQWEDMGGVIHGFTYNIKKKEYTSLDAPGAAFTQAWGMNDDGVVAVSAAESSGTESFAYCPTSKGCPTAGAAFRRNAQHPSGKAVPRAN